MRRTSRSLLVAVALFATACSGGDEGGGADAGIGQGPSATPGSATPGSATPGSATPGSATVPATRPATTSAPTTNPPDLATATARLVQVAAVEQPTALAVRPGDMALYVAEKTGRVRAVPAGQTAQPGPVGSAPVLDLSGEVSGGTEQGLLGLTFSPDGAKLYVNYTDRSGDTRVVEYGFAAGRADPGTRRELLMVDQPFVNHNGGQVSFGPDGMLYVGLGDGGSANDPFDNAQNLGTLLGSVLRLSEVPSAGLPYTVPADNPFVGRRGARGEIWAYGLRNPWRFSWDRATGDWWVGDVGQNAREEIDFLPAGHRGGANFGWPLLEGTRANRGQNPDGGVLPLFEYGRDDGCSITGGYVYRGAKVPALRGAYVFGDACTGTVWGLTQSGGQVVDQSELSLSGLAAAVAGGGFNVASFGEDSGGELYLLALGGGVYRFEAS